MQSMPEMIRETRKAMGLTQSALAVAANVGEATVRRIERGESPSVESLERVAGALGLGVVLVHDKDAGTPAVAGEESPHNHEPGAASDSSGARLAHSGG